ncbi:MAG: type II toxin-antitoxin system RelE/ParE family toxin [Planctomycetes bacterium]|nr:type II toxin-antitoxin system RelE/ParE family toxin [Planctomycetota bacterium]
MNLPVVFRGLALADVEAAFDYYEAKLSGLGSRFAEELHRTVMRLSDHPESGVAARHGVRVTHIPVFWYRVFFLPEPERVVVLAVRHPAKRPPRVAELLGEG